mmetsp:Transcript_13427/g.6589  ORF Transcript_13427/g.6589 Transcript_13427/m.6589 type:complete len:318 (-) Transcript_13427:1925-2878(-)
MYKVMIRDNISPLAKEILEKTGKIEVVIDKDKSTSKPEVLSKLIGEFHGLGIRSGTKVTREVLEKAKNLKVIGRAGVGVDNIDLDVASERKIIVMNTPGGNTVTTAEHTISLMMALARNIAQGTATLKDGRWEKKKLLGVEITGKTLGIVGLGQIGKIVADRAKGLHMKVIAVDPFVSQKQAKEIGVELVKIDELYKRADFITLHVPRLDETRNMINSLALSKMKQEVRLINCSRGEVVNLDDLYEALVDGHVGGAALDVFPVEPPPPSMQIMQLDNVIFTPHLGASTLDAQQKVAEMIANQMVSYLIDGKIINSVL